jgi:hypothetical protein
VDVLFSPRPTSSSSASILLYPQTWVEPGTPTAYTSLNASGREPVECNLRLLWENGYKQLAHLLVVMFMADCRQMCPSCESHPDKLACKVFLCKPCERIGVWGRCCRTGPFSQPHLLFRVPPGSVLQGSVPARKWVTVGYQFHPGP